MYDQLTWTQLTLIYFNSHPNVHPTHSYFLVYICTHWRWCKKFCTLLRLENQCVSIRCCHWSSLCWYSHDVCFSSLSDMFATHQYRLKSHCRKKVFRVYNEWKRNQYFFYSSFLHTASASIFLPSVVSWKIDEEIKISRKSPNRLMIAVLSSIDQTRICKHNRRL